MAGEEHCHGNTRASKYMFILRAEEGQVAEDLDLPEWDAGKMQFLAYQIELGPQGGRAHVQGCVALKKPNRPGGASAAMSMPFNRVRRTSFRVMAGTPEQAVAYCTSNQYCAACHRGKGPRVLVPGNIECMCGHATDKGVVADIEAFFRGSLAGPITHTELVVKAQSGLSMNHLLTTQADYVARNIRFVEKVLSCVSPARCAPPVVVYIYGASGEGKTRFASSICTTAQTFYSWSTQWFDGLTSSTMHVVLDDVRPEKSTPPAFWLRLLDRYPFRVPVKGSSVEFSVPVITMTAPCAPEEWWAQVCGAHSVREDPTQFLRRITHVLELPRDVEQLDAVRFSMRTAMRQHVITQVEPNVEYDPVEAEAPPTHRARFEERMGDLE
jgi:hypothetical protein